MSEIGRRDNMPYVNSTPKLRVRSSSFEDWFQAHEKACTGDKQLARDAYAAGMGDPLVTYACPPIPEDEWAQCLAISERPDIDEQIRALLENQDGDNAIMLVRSIVRITRGQPV